MQSVGESLRATRLDLGLTLEQVSASTRISVKSLRAIEADELASIGSAFFYKSFVRQFAVELGLDYAQLSQAVQAAANSIPEPRIPGHDGAPPLRASRQSRKRTSGLRWVFSLASLAVVMVACSTVYAMWQNSRAEIQSSVSSFVQSVTSGGNAVPSPKKAASKPAASAAGGAADPLPPVSGRLPAPTVMTEPGSFDLKLSALEATWLSVAANGKQVFSGILQQSETKVVEGCETARIRTGNAGGLEVELNGRSIGSLGPRGQIRTVVFRKDAFEIVPPPLAYLALTGFSLDAR
ncbi:MAG: DUF4115 domain-containing protein [Acidobacteriaceae bacterium]|nr:DUF4115 domain-containing protein [Acidobacteriaceae bacterium]MBV8569565.1 DUF4115 domain-containing protein [Acidobacteriaceae bacterium]